MFMQTLYYSRVTGCQRSVLNDPGSVHRMRA
jgi:hypothetical protein